MRTHLTTSVTMEGGGSLQTGGTPMFMAPELWKGGRLRPPVDVYAFAMVCYEVTSEGEYPFMGLNQGMLIDVVLRGMRPERPDAASDRMWALMEKAWAQDAKERPTFVQIGTEMDSW
ncbi:kinase-like domain-containing protein [Hyaloraphidium curvatum]|nr:kinase-like domain-containing protein [Hyaloraphidium curvatum]